MNKNNSLLRRLEQEYFYKSFRDVGNLAEELSEIATHCKNLLNDVDGEVDYETRKIIAEIGDPKKDIEKSLKRAIFLFKNLEKELQEKTG